MDCLQVLEDYITILQQIGAQGHIAFTGGDVFFRENDFWILAEKTKEYGISFSVLGNPYLLDKSKATHLKDLGIRNYQISLDGLERTHDQLRQPGSFRKTIWALYTLENMGIRTSVMFTLSPLNVKDLIPVMDLVGQIGVSSFSFDRVSDMGEAKQFEGRNLSAMEYRTICEDYLEHSQTLKEKGVVTNYTFKSHLFSLLFYERGELDPLVIGKHGLGCPVGRSGIAVLADGSVLPCRRIPIIIGKVPEQSIAEILNTSEVLKRFRQRSSYQKCRSCELYSWCRGCPAVAYGVTGDPFAADPHCWK
jgi:radical SAM protein with 4Fe4S-binding SPASM domain